VAREGSVRAMQDADFSLKHVGALTAGDFERSLLWAGYYEPDDVEEIVRWGTPEDVVRTALDAVGWEDDHYFPIPLEAARSDWMRGKLYAAQITCADGSTFAGYIGEGRDYVAIFKGGETFVLSSRFPEVNRPLPGPMPLAITNRVTDEIWHFPPMP
jgi:hypothetical protein